MNCVAVGIRVAVVFIVVRSASARTWTEVGDAGDLPGTAQAVSLPVGVMFLTFISGSTGPGDLADAYRIHLLEPALFSASTVGGATWNTQLWLFISGTGIGIRANDDAAEGVLQSTLSGPVQPGEPAPPGMFLPSGIYTLAISGSNNDPFSAGGDIFDQQTPFQQSGPDGPGGFMPVIGWHGGGETGSYTIFLTGVGEIPAAPSMGVLAAAALAGKRRRRCL